MPVVAGRATVASPKQEATASVTKETDMAFTAVQKRPWQRVALFDEVKFRNSETGGAIVFIARNIFEAMGSPKRVEILVGDGTDTGMIMIRKAISGTGYKVFVPEGKGAVKVGISPGRIGLKPKTEPIASLIWRMWGGDLIVELPVQQSAPRLVAAE